MSVVPEHTGFQIDAVIHGAGARRATSAKRNYGVGEAFNIVPETGTAEGRRRRYVQIYYVCRGISVAHRKKRTSRAASW